MKIRLRYDTLAHADATSDFWKQVCQYEPGMQATEEVRGYDMEYGSSRFIGTHFDALLIASEEFRPLTMGYWPGALEIETLTHEAELWLLMSLPEHAEVLP